MGHTPHTWTAGETITAAPLNAIEQDLAAAQTATDVAAAVSAASTNDRARANHTGTQAASTVTGLSTVATSGAYADLSGKPTIPTQYTDAQAQAANASALAGKANIADIGTAGTATGDALRAAYAAVLTASSFGAKCDGQVGYTGQAASGSATFTDASAAFTTALIGRKFTHFLTPGSMWTGTILDAPTPTTLTISAPAPYNSQVASGTAGAMGSGSSNLTDAGATFTANMVGAAITVQGAGAAGAALVGQVQAVASATSLYICKTTDSSTTRTAAATVSGKTWTINQGRYWIGTDDTAAWQAAIAAATTGPLHAITWSGVSTVSATLQVPGGVRLVGHGMEPCSSAIALPVNGSVLMPHGDFVGAATTDTAVVQTAQSANYTETNIGAQLADCTINAAQITDVAVLNKGNLSKFTHVEFLAGRTAAYRGKGWQSTFYGCIAGQTNYGDCVHLNGEIDSQWYGGYLRNGANQFHLSSASDTTIVGAHPFGGYGNSNTAPSINALIDGSSQQIKFVGCDFDDSLGPQVRIAPGAGQTIADVTFSGCNFYEYASPFFTWPDNTHPAIQLDASAGAGTFVSRITIGGGTRFNGLDSTHRYKSILDVVAGAGSVTTVLLDEVFATWVAAITSSGTPSSWNIGSVTWHNGSSQYRNPFGTTFTATGTGAATTFTSAHNLGSQPRRYVAVPNNAAAATACQAAGSMWVTADATNIIINFATAPANGASMSFAYEAAL